MHARVPPSGAGAGLFILHVTAPGAVGGLERVVQTLAAGLRQAGHDARVAAVLDEGTGSTPFLAGLEAAAVPVVPVPLPPRAYLGERRRLADLFRGLGPDLVHTHGYRADVQAGAVARRLGFPTVTTVHGFTGGGWKNRFYEALQRRAFRRCDAVVAVSRPLGERLRAGGVPAGRVHVVPNAAPPPVTSLPRDAARRELGLSDGAFVAGWVGRLSHEKAPDQLVEALVHTPGHIGAVIIGEGPAGSSSRILAEERGVASRVRWAGAHPDAGSLFPAFDCFVLSSRTEGTPMVLFEAMAAGVPVVARAVGGVPDVVSDAEALLVRSPDPAALGAAIASVAADPAAARERCQAARRRLDDYRVAPWVDRYEAVYRGILASTSHRSPV
jgi:glycosyltransferase involved in cell wall biosynthesis